MEDIVSDLCNLPTGVFQLWFIPRHEIGVWENGVPFANTRWYGVSVYRDSLTFDEQSEQNNQGVSNGITVTCLVVNDTSALRKQLAAMQKMRFVLKLEHLDGKNRIVGTPTQFVELISKSFTPSEIVGAQGHRLTFKGTFDEPAFIVE